MEVSTKVAVENTTNEVYAKGLTINEVTAKSLSSRASVTNANFVMQEKETRLNMTTTSAQLFNIHTETDNIHAETVPILQCVRKFVFDYLKLTIFGHFQNIASSARPP